MILDSNMHTCCIHNQLKYGYNPSVTDGTTNDCNKIVMIKRN